jgi:iron complex transport system substrate-binding protein
MPSAALRLALALAAAAVACTAAPAEPRHVVDGAGRSLAIEDTSRVASIGGSATEILYALGLEDRIVAVDITSVYPPEAQQKPSVGYIRSLSAEGVLSVTPSLVIAEADAGPPETVDLLKSASVPLVLLPDDKSIDGVLAKIRLVGEVMDAVPEAEALAEAVAADFAALEAKLAGVEPVRTLFLFSLTDGRILAAGRETSADAMLAMAGAENVFPDFSGYKPVNAEAVLAAAPDAIVTLSGSSGSGPGAAIADILADPALSRTPAAAAGRFITMNASYLLGFGPRTAHAARDLARELHPELRLPDLAARPWSERPHGNAVQ